MQSLHFSIDIQAPREHVWNVLWNDATYRDWTSAFSDGSYAVSDWNEGSRIQFLDPGGSGMSAIIEKKTPNQFMSFKHMAEIRKGEDQPPADWSGARENYTLTDNGGGTSLSVHLECPEEYKAMFEEKFPRALQRVKALAEK